MSVSEAGDPIGRQVQCARDASGQAAAVRHGEFVAPADLIWGQGLVLIRGEIEKIGPGIVAVEVGDLRRTLALLKRVPYPQKGP